MCPECEAVVEVDMLLHWANAHHRAETLLDRCLHGTQVEP